MRIPDLDRAAMTAERARLYDATRAAGGIVTGPFRAWIRWPRIFRAAQALRSAVAPDPLTIRERQLVFLIVARHYGARYPWHAQVRESFAAGLDQAAIEAINDGRRPGLADPAETCCCETAAELVATGRLGDAGYAAAEARLGERRLVGLVAAVGYFCMTSLAANVFRIEPPDDSQIPLKP
jgi:4-carboxymuconolactone decarboxylase